MVPGLQLTQVLKSLIPTTQEELSLLRYVIYHAQLLQRGAPVEKTQLASLQGGETMALAESQARGLDLPTFLAALSEEAKRYFHGLVEALEIHQSIHGEQLLVQNLTLSDKAVYELKQIRDMCLDDGLHSIY